MTISKYMYQFLQHTQTDYQIIRHPRTANLIQAAEASRISLNQFIRAHLYQGGGKIVMAVTTLHRVIDPGQLSRVVKQTLQPLSPQELFVLFKDCECGVHPPVGMPYAVDMVIDPKVRALSKVYFEAGNHTEVICLQGKDYQRLTEQALWAPFSREDLALETMYYQRFGAGDMRTAPTAADCLTVECEIKKRFERLYPIPTLPSEVRRISEIQDGSSSVQELTRMIEEDGQVATQLLAYVNSQRKNSSDNIQQAVAESLGFDAAKQITLGFALTKPFEIPFEGPLGLKAHWRHATYCARFVKTLAGETLTHPVKIDLAYLSGLLHNIGFLLFGHLFQPEFKLLNKLVAANPDSPITTLEKHAIGMGQAKHVLGMGHGQLGAWLMTGWQMPEEIVVTQKEHHNADYRGHHWQYSGLSKIANHMLKRIGIGDASDGKISKILLADLGLSERQVEALFADMMKQASNLDALAIRCAA